MKNVLILLMILACHLTVHSKELTTEDKLYGLSLLWQEANYNFAFFDQVPDLDWDKEYREAIPKVLATQTNKEYYQELQRFLAKLQDGHTQVYFPEELEQTQSNLKIRVKVEEGRYYIIDVAKRLKKSFPIGSELVEINGLSVCDYVEEFVKPYLSSSTEQGYIKLIEDHLFYGDKGDKLTLKVFYDGDYVEKKIERNYLKYGDYCEQYKCDFDAFEIEKVDNKMIVSLNSFEQENIVQQFKEIIPELNKTQGVVIDLRNNVGGKSIVGLNIAKYLIQGDELITLPWKSKHHIASHKAWGNSGLQLVGYESVTEYEDFGSLQKWLSISSDTLSIKDVEQKVTVPIKILINENTASSAENFVAYLQNEKSVEIIGTPTFGSSGQPIYFALPGGGYARICAKRNYLINGEDYIGVGISPDFYIKNRVEDYLENTDRQLQEALRRFR